MTTPEVIAAKQATRQRILGLRDALSGTARQQKAALITERLLALPAFAGASTIAAYASFGNEFDTSAFVGAVLAQDKRLILPRVVRASRQIRFHFVTDLDTSLLPGPWGILEPDPLQCPGADARQIDFMLVPGIAFTPRGERLGYGGGYYDKVISALRASVIKVAAAFAVQIVEALPLEPHDRRVDTVVTEEAVYVTNP